MMYLKDEKIIVKLTDDIAIRSWKLDGVPSQLMFDPTAMTGWTDGVSARRDTTARLNSNGDFMEPAKLNARYISLSGIAIANTITEFQILRDNFMAAFSGAYGDYQSISVETASGRRYATVGLEGKPNWIQTLDTAASWKLDLYAPDPHVYGEPQQVTIGLSSPTVGGLKIKDTAAFALRYPLNYNNPVTQSSVGLISNRGNAVSWPQFKVQGTYNNGFELFDNRNSKVAYVGVVTPQAPVIIDMGRGTATQNGVDKTALVTTREWFPLGPDEIVRPEIRAINGGSGWCNVLFSDTYI